MTILDAFALEKKMDSNNLYLIQNKLIYNCEMKDLLALFSYTQVIYDKLFNHMSIFRLINNLTLSTVAQQLIE